MTLNVMSWNVLAKCPAKRFLEETIAGLEARTTKRIDIILEKNPDILLLQEVDRYFVEKLNENAEIATNYVIYYQQDELIKGILPDKIFGNGIMVKKTNKYIRINKNKKMKTISSDDETLYDKKNAVYMDIKYKNKVIRLISIHLSGREKRARKNLSAEVHKKCKERSYCIIGGDCNSIDSCTESYKGNKATVCSFDYAEGQKINDDDILEIDKIFVKNMQIENFSVQNDGICDTPHYVHKNIEEKIKKIKENIQKYGSDHFYILAHIEPTSKSRSRSRSRGRTRKKRSKSNRRSHAPSRKTRKKSHTSHTSQIHPSPGLSNREVAFIEF
jgi:endonuclease/exonuclease/phosphatase family metal-dependent hydrolase